MAKSTSSTSLTTFSDIIASRPDAAAPLRRLEAYVGKFPPRTGVFTLNSLFDAAKPQSMSQLVVLLDDLVRAGLLRRIYRIQSAAGGGIGDYASFVEIPSSVFDVRVGREVAVGREQIQLIFTPSDR